MKVTAATSKDPAGDKPRTPVVSVVIGVYGVDAKVGNAGNKRAGKGL